jgi:quinol monooxygenase YgiN
MIRRWVVFVLVVRFRVLPGKERALEQLFGKERAKACQEEANLLLYDLHRKIGDATEILLYERYRDRQDWAVTHRSKPYIKEFLAELAKYVDGEIVREEYELAQFD